MREQGLFLDSSRGRLFGVICEGTQGARTADTWEEVIGPALRRYRPELINITGEMTGLKDPQLQALQRFASDRQYVNINMARLQRIDFVCAGKLANVIAALKAK